LFNDTAAKNLIQTESLTSSAGPVFSDREGNNFGLFNKHCVVCHGLSGSGAGPAAVFQNPYPRDFRLGVFKWKSTTRNAKPTREDLVDLLHRGVPGTGMPSFALIDEKDASALIDYLTFLAVRGETERRLQAFAVDELGYDDEDGEPEERLAASWANDSSSDSLTSDSDVRRIVQEVVGTWTDAGDEVVSVPSETSNDRESIARGKDLFHGQIANCVGCHGPAGNGGAITIDFDDWAKEYSSRIGLTPTDREAMKPFRDLGALQPRQIKPRQLNQGVFHGAGDAPAIYRQISQGIAGTPMPSLTITQQPSTTGLTPDQVWDLVHYVQSLSVSGKNASEVSNESSGR
jgi:mono/diheme cytochrome c family protein